MGALSFGGEPFDPGRRKDAHTRKKFPRRLPRKKPFGGSGRYPTATQKNEE